MVNSYLDAFRASGGASGYSGGGVGNAQPSTGANNPHLAAYRVSAAKKLVDQQQQDQQKQVQPKPQAPAPQNQNWFEKGLAGVGRAFTTDLGKNLGGILGVGKEMFVDPAARVVQQTALSGQIHSKNDNMPTVIADDNFTKSQNAEIDRALKAGQITKQKADQLRAKTATAVNTTKQAISSAEKNVGVKYDPSVGVQGIIDTVANLGGVEGAVKGGVELAAKTGKTLFDKMTGKTIAKDIAPKDVTPPTIAPPAPKPSPTLFDKMRNQGAPEQPHVNEAGSVPAPSVPKAEPGIKSTAKVSSLTPEAQKGADKMQLDYLNEKAKTQVLTTGEKTQRNELKVKAAETAPTAELVHPMHEPIFTAAKTQAEKRLGRELTPAETTKLTDDTQKLVQEKFPQEPVTPVPKEVPLSEPKPAEGDKVSGNSARIQQNALEKKLTQNMGDLPQYKSINMKDQAKQAVDLVNNDRQKALDIINGKANPPDGLHAQSVHQALEDVAVKEGNGQLLTQLAKSHINTELSEGAQKMRIAAERDPHSPVEQIRQIQEARQKAAERRAGTTVAKETVKATDAVAKATKVTTKEDLHNFIQGLVC